MISEKELTSLVQYIADDYTMYSGDTITSIMVFPEMCVHLIRISHTLMISGSHMLLVGLPVCGKKIILKLAMHLLRGLILTVEN